MKKILSVIIIIVMVALTIHSAYALTATIDAPSTVIEGQLISINFGADEIANLELYKDGTYLTNAAPYDWQTTTSDAGLYTFTVVAQNENGTTNSSKNVEVVDSDLQISINEPSQDEYATTIIPLSVIPDSPVELCYYIIGSQSNTLTKDEETGAYVGELIKDDGIYTITFKCKQGTEVAEEEKTILIDTTAPNIIQSSPSNGAIISEPEITITTDEIATCKLWPATQDETSASIMNSDDKLTHRTSLDLKDGTYNYFVKCKDVYGNQELQKQFNFVVDNPVTATVKLENDVLNIGLHDIVVKFSEDVTQPLLSYSYQSGGSGNIVLSKDSDSKWTGQIRIEEDQGEKIGSFKLMESGSEIQITEGKIFQIDTDKPNQITDIKIAIEDEKILLTWISDEKDFIIYRTEGNELTYADEFVSTTKKTYYDGSVDLGKTYYYAIVAVDDAKNKGPLSKIVSMRLTPEKNNYETTELGTRIESMLMDINSAYKQLESEKDDETLYVINELDILKELTDYMARLKEIQADVDNMNDEDYELYQNKVNRYAEELSDIYSKIPRRITIESSMDFDQPTDMSIQNLLIPKLSNLLGIQDKVAYAKTLEHFMDNSKISGKIIVAKILYYDKHEEAHTFIKKDIEFPQQLTDVTLIEYLPDEFTKGAKPIFTPELSPIEQDRVMQYLVPMGTTNLEIKYSIPQKRDLATARTVRTVLFPDELDENSLTGNVINETNYGFTNYWFYVLGGIMIAGLLVYYFTLDNGPGMKELIEALALNKHQTSYYPPPNYASYYPKSRIIPRGTFVTPRTIKPKRDQSIKNGLDRDTQLNKDTQFNKYNQHNSLQINPNVSLSKLLSNAHTAIDDKDYVVAKELYSQIINQLKNPIMNIDIGHKIEADILYNKILLYQKFVMASAAATTGKRDDLESALEEVSSLARKVPETDSKLITEAKAAYVELKRVANKLAIQEIDF